MTSREEALREVLLEAADEIDASRLPPLRPTERGWGRSVAGRGHRARRLSRVLIPLAAAGSVAAVTAGILSFGGVLGHRQPTPGPGAAHHGAHATRATATADSAPPAYYLTLTGVAYPWYDHPLQATVRATATGRVLATITAPAPYGTFSAVAGAANGRTFVLAAQPWQPQSNSAYVDNNSAAPVRFFLLTIGADGSVSGLKPLPQTDVTGPEQEQSAALSPDGTMLAVAAGASAAAGQVANEQVRVYDLATSAQRTWTLTGSRAAGGFIDAVSWAADDQTLAYDWAGPRAGIYLLMAAGPGGDLMSDARPVPAPAGSPHVSCLGGAMLTPDGTTIVCPAALGGGPRKVTDKRHLRSRVTGNPGPFVQGYAEFAASSGRLLRVIDEFTYGHSAIDDNGSPLLLWVSRSGDAIVGQDFYPNPIVAILGRNSSARIPWSARISAGQGSESEAAW